MIQRVDADGSGTIDGAEVAAARDALVRDITGGHLAHRRRSSGDARCRTRSTLGVPAGPGRPLDDAARRSTCAPRAPALGHAPRDRVRIDLRDRPRRLEARSSSPARRAAAVTATTAATVDRTNALRSYPKDVLASPASTSWPRRSRRGSATAASPSAPCRRDGNVAAAEAGRDHPAAAGVAGRPVPAADDAASCSSPCWSRWAGARCTPSRRATARRWWPRTWPAPAAPLGTRSRSAPPSRSRTRRRVRARVRDADAVGVHPAGAALPVAEPRLRRAGARRSAWPRSASGCARYLAGRAAARASAHRRTSTATRTATRTITRTPTSTGMATTTASTATRMRRPISCRGARCSRSACRAA